MDPLRRGSRSWADAERRLQQIQTVLRPGEGQPPAQLARPVEKIPALGGGQFFLIGNVIENQFITVGEWNFGSAISMIMAAIMMLCMYLIRRVDEHNSGGRKKRA